MCFFSPHAELSTDLDPALSSEVPLAPFQRHCLPGDLSTWLMGDHLTWPRQTGESTLTKKIKNATIGDDFRPLRKPKPAATPKHWPVMSPIGMCSNTGARTFSQVIGYRPHIPSLALPSVGQRATARGPFPATPPKPLRSSLSGRGLAQGSLVADLGLNAALFHGPKQKKGWRGISPHTIRCVKTLIGILVNNSRLPD
jgi:hypothetical protein